MDLYILRHGIAAERDPQKYPDDDLRPLTPEGRRKAKRVAAALKDLGYEFDLILSSPLKRALKTAEIVAAVFQAEGRLEVTSHLEPGGDPGKLIAEIAARRRQSVLLVGHEPYLSQLISVLLSGRTGLEIDLKKAGFCHLQIEHPAYGRCAALSALYPPKVLLVHS